MTFALTSNDAASKNYNAADAPFTGTGVPYDTWTWGAGTAAPVLTTGGTVYTNPATDNVCAGA